MRAAAEKPKPNKEVLKHRPKAASKCAHKKQAEMPSVPKDTRQMMSSARAEHDERLRA